MDTLQPLLIALQAKFTRSEKKGHLFSNILLAIIIPFGSAQSSNLYRKLTQILGYLISKTKFYRFMASKCLPWDKICHCIFKLIPLPLSNGRLLFALDDSTTPKSGKKIFACEHFFDHAAKHNQSKYPWSQCFVQIGLLKFIHTRWAFLPLVSRFYQSTKAISTDKFKSKIEQSIEMILSLSCWSKAPILVVMDSWFGNGKLYIPLKDKLGSRIHILSMLRKNSALYEFPPAEQESKRGRPAKYGKQAGSVKSLAQTYKAKAKKVQSFVYGKQREMTIYESTFMSKSFKCAVKVIFAYYKNHYVALVSTDLTLSAEEILEYYSARWKIESGFKELKHDIGSQSTQARLKSSVINHLNLCMVATTLIWIATISLQEVAVAELICQGVKPQFTFAQARKLIINNLNKRQIWDQNKNEPKIHQKSWLQMIVQLAA